MMQGSKATGYPRRDGDLDVASGFKNPPPGYGEVPFWWWTGEDLDPDRMVAQIEALHEKGVSGVQVNYSHHDTPGWPTDQASPGIFTEAWWKVFETVRKACVERGMGIGLSTYTLDWPNGAHNLFWHLFYRHEKWNAHSLEKQGPWRAKGGECFQQVLEAGTFHVLARPAEGDLDPDTVLDLTGLVVEDRLNWKSPAGAWEVWAFHTERKVGSYNPLRVGAGETILDGFYRPFERRAGTTEGLNYFFNDELQVGAGPFGWNPDFPDAFRNRKGYDLLPHLPALWQDVGPRTPKVRLDAGDVRMALSEERYFEPIFRWHHERGLIFACDSCGRGRNPAEHGDYFRATRWYTAPGHDTPGGKADLIKGKVSSSIANLYRRPRVWLEGYHSLGWGALPEHLMGATLENYLYGCTLLNLHGFYYTTLGSHWEWAPPCYHRRMPWWDHMGTFLRYFERLSFVLSQGHFVCDIALVYPVAPFEAGLDGKKAAQTTFALAEQLMAAGLNFEFLDHESLARAETDEGRLVLPEVGASYRILIFADMEAVRFGSLAKAASFTEQGGVVLSVGTLPSASDRAGRDDLELTALNEVAFPMNRRFASPEQAVSFLTSCAAVGMGWTASGAEPSVAGGFPWVPDVRGLTRTVRWLRRRVPGHDVFLVMDAKPGDRVLFRATGRVACWDPWTGDQAPVAVLASADGVTCVQWPEDENLGQLIVFSSESEMSPRAPVPELGMGSVPAILRNQTAPFQMPVADPVRQTSIRATDDSLHRERQGDGSAVPSLVRSANAKTRSPERILPLPGEWSVTFLPTMDNARGDFRLPVTDGNRVIGLEARTWDWARQPGPGADSAVLPSPHDLAWRPQTHGDGPKFWVLGPLADGDPSLEGHLASLVRVDPEVPVVHGGVSHRWAPYDFSWRMGRGGDPGHQGYHGLKGTVTDDFLCLGVAGPGLNETRYGVDGGRSFYYIHTSAWAEGPVDARLESTSVPGEALGHTSPILSPGAVWLNGERVRDPGGILSLKAGANPMVIRYDQGGRGHLVLRKAGVALPRTKPVLAMTWHGDPGLIPWDPFAAEPAVEWFRFTTAPATRAITVTSHGKVRAFLSGEPMVDRGHGRWEAKTLQKRMAEVILRVEPEPGSHGGAIFPEPLAIVTEGEGLLELGDWSKMGLLRHYSGRVCYRTTVTLTDKETNAAAVLDLGAVAGTAEVRVNGRSAGIRVVSPWKVPVAGLLRPGTNEVAVTVCNSLSNHYQTIPSRYRGDPTSGLLGPVGLVF